MPTDRFEEMIHGLRVSSEFAIGGHGVGATPDGVDLVIEAGELPVSEPSGSLILAYDFDGGRTVRAFREPDRSVIIEFSDLARFSISPALDRVTLGTPCADLRLASVLLQGWVMSMVLMLRGSVVFHASAVYTSDRAIGLLAHSGMGKSTVSAMLVRDGAALISDDVLRVDRSGPGFVAFPGNSTIRLRAAASGLADAIPDAIKELTPDDRIAVRVPTTRTTPTTLSAMLIPVPSRTDPRPRIEWLQPQVAAFELNAYPRVYEWKDTQPIRTHFEMAADMAGTVPTGFFFVPWGPPWRIGLLDEVLQLLQVEACGDA